MSNIQEVFNKLQKHCNSNFYYSMRIEDKELKPITVFKRKQPILDQFNYVKFRINELPDGVYIIACARDRTFQDVTRYELIKDSTKPEIINKHVSNSKIENAELMENISLDEYISIIRENEQLRAQVATLQTQLKLTEDFYKEKGLSEPAAGQTAEIIKELAPSALGLLEQFMQQQNRKLDIEEKKLSSQPAKGIKINRSQLSEKKNTLNPLQALELNLQAALQQENDEMIENVLEEIYNKFPAFYDSIIEKYNIEETDETDENEYIN